MAISRLTYAYVEQEGKAPNCKMRTASGELQTYLEAHVDDLVGRRDDGRSPPSTFNSTDVRARLDLLHTGTDTEFLEAAQLLAARLQKEMDGRTKRGFFVALTRETEGVTQTAVLKLDVLGKYGAAIGTDTAGEPDLEAFKDLLDIPGELQKGAVFPDTRADSDLTVGDKLPETSLYFLRALDVQQVSAPGPATGSLLKAVRDVAPNRVLAVSKALEQETRTTPEDFFQRHPDLVTQEQSGQVLDRLRQQKRPVREIDPSARPLIGSYSADGLTIRGPLAYLRDKVTITQRPGGWRIQIDVTEQPRLDPR